MYIEIVSPQFIYRFHRRKYFVVERKKKLIANGGPWPEFNGRLSIYNKIWLFPLLFPSNWKEPQLKIHPLFHPCVVGPSESQFLFSQWVHSTPTQCIPFALVHRFSFLFSFIFLKYLIFFKERVKKNLNLLYYTIYN